MENKCKKIYVIKNKVNKKVYIGTSTKVLSNILATHKYNAKHAVKNSKLHKAMRKIGFEKFYIEQLDGHDAKYWVDHYDSYNNGYNVNPDSKNGGMWGRFGKDHPLSKKIKQYSLEGKYIKTWESIGQIRRENKFHQSNISACCSGKLKTAHGFIWKFKGAK